MFYNVGFGEWEWKMLTATWDTKDLESWGLEVPEYRIPGEATEDEYEVPPDGIETTTIQVGDILTFVSDRNLLPHRLVCGDSTKKETIDILMDGRMADLVLTDPPYNVNYKAEGSWAKHIGGQGTAANEAILNDHMPQQAFRLFLENSFGALVPFVNLEAAWYVTYASIRHREFEDALEANGIEVRNQIIWTKLVAAMGWGDYRWKHEPILYAHRKGFSTNFYGDRKQYTEWTEQKTPEQMIKMMRTHINRMAKILRGDQTDDQLLASIQKLITTQENGNSTVWRFNRDYNYVHPTQKPVALFGKAIKNSTRKGQVVLDSFGGSGTTMVASHQLGRTAYLCEMSPKHCQAIVNRMRALDESVKVLRNGEKFLSLTP